MFDPQPRNAPVPYLMFLTAIVFAISFFADNAWADGGTISGQVTRDSDGAGISGVSVYIYDSSWSWVKSGLTDSAGNYSISGLAGGNYHINTYNSLGYVDEYYNNATSQSSATTVNVASAATTSNINFRLAFGGAISGRVTRDSDGAGISGVSVYVNDSSWSWIEEGMTDSAGNYSIAGLAAGSYYVRTNNSLGYIDEWYDNAASSFSATMAIVALGETISGVDFELIFVSGGTITGQVTRDSDGAGISGAFVDVYDSSWMYVKSGTTDSAGNYSVSHLAAGSYYVQTRNSLDYADEYYNNATARNLATAVNVASGEATSNINFGLAVSGAIAGRVTRDSDGAGISGLSIRIHNASWKAVKTGTTDSAGNYSISGLAEGSYYVKTINSFGYVDEFYNNVMSSSSATAVSIASGATTANIDFGLALGGTISGRVTQDSDGAGIEGVSVSIRDASWNWWSGLTDSAGNYSITGVAAGSYHVGTSISSGYVNEYYNNVRVSSGAITSDIDFGLALSGAVAGRVTRDSDGAGISGVHIYVYDASGDVVKTGTTDAAGNYSVTGLAAGSYYVRTYDCPGYVDEYYDAAVSVASGATTANINIQLGVGSTVTGRVARGFDGTGISGVSILIHDANWKVVKTGTTDAAGNYSVSGLAAGSYYVRTYEYPGYVDEYYTNATTQSSATKVSVASGATTANIDFQLGVGGTATGRVTRDSDGAGIAGIYIVIYDSSYYREGGTDAAGNYSISGLPAGNYYVKTSNSLGYVDEYYNNVTSQSSAATVSVAVETTTANIDFQLGVGGTATGRVARDPDGAGIAGVYVNIYDAGWNLLKSDLTDSAGNYGITGLAAGNYYMKTVNFMGYLDEYYNNVTSQSSATAVNVASGVTTTGVDFGLAIRCAIAGRVVRDSDGAGIEGAAVRVFTSFSTMDNYQTAFTDSQGYYYLGGLAPGDYFVSVRSGNHVQEYYGNTIYNWNAETVSVASGDVTENINFSLATGGSISGRVTRNSNGIGMPDVSIYAYDPDRNWDYSDPDVFTKSDSDGYYRISGMPAGRYVVLASWENNESVSKYYSDAKSEAAATRVAVVADEDTPDIDFALSNGSISGSITCSGCEIEGLSVQAQAYDSDWNLIKSAAVWVQGPTAQYGMDGLLPGEYYVGVKARGYGDNYYNSADSRSGAVLVTVAQDAVAENINFDLGAAQATGSISGKVTSASNASDLGNVVIEVFDSDWNLIASSTPEWPSSEYSIEGLLPGSYWLRAYRRNGFAAEYYDSSPSGSGATAVTVAQGMEAPDIDFILDAGLAIYGYVFDNANHKFIQGVQVTAYNDNWAVVGTGVSDFEGRFGIEGLTPGEYYLHTQNNLGYRDEYNHNTGFMSRAAKVKLLVADRFVSFGLDKGAAAQNDFNGDGQADILWRNSETGEIILWHMDGGDRIESVSIGTVSDLHWRIAGAGDFNGNGKMDILWRNVTTGENYLWYMNGTMAGGTDTLTMVEDQNWRIAGVADFNDNGKADILWRNEATGENYVWYMEDAAVSGGGVLPTLGEKDWKIAGVGDFNDNGKADILWRNTSTGENCVWYMDGATVAGKAALPTVEDQSWGIGGIGDYSNDGQPDVLWRNAATGENYVWRLSGATVSAGALLEAVTDAKWLMFDVGDIVRRSIGVDFNDDGKPDILWRNTSTGENYVWYMDGATITGGGVLPAVQDQNWKIAGVGDFNDNGKPDILWRNVSTGENYIWYLNGVTVAGSDALQPVPDQDWNIVGVADFNSDGKPDILWRNVSTGENYIWYLNGVTVAGSDALQPVPDQSWKIGGVIDFYNDGTPDILWRDTSSGENHVWHMSGATVTGRDSIPAVPDQNWKIVGIADYNGDVKPDILWRNTSSGENYIWYLDGTEVTGSERLPAVTDQAWFIAPQSY